MTRYYCNTRALNPPERAQHSQLTRRLVSARRQIIEKQDGYEFQFKPSEISIAELASWVAAESKCCPFFDFRIALDHPGTLLRLQLAGEEGIKPFIRAEFNVPEK